MHYGRLRRNASLDLIAPPEKITQSAGYILTIGRDHPLSTGNLRVYEHRLVYYNAHGKGPFNCHWCGKEITWATLHIDHLDETKTNNAVENLVVSCPFCNQQRGKERSIAKRSTWLECGDDRMTVKQLAQRLGISTCSVHWRIKHGWPVDKIINEPRGAFGPQSRRDCNLEVGKL